MSSLHFVVHPLPGTEDQLNDRLKDVSDKISRLGYTCPSALHPLRGHTIQSIAVGPSHIALLLEDGRVCRLSYSVLSERLDLTKSEPKATSKEKSAKIERNSRGIRVVDSPLILVRGEELGSDAMIGRFSLGSTSTGNGAAARNNNTTTAPSTTTGSTVNRAPTRQRGSRVMRCVGRGRGTGVIVGNVPGGRSLLPSSALPVPDELINQCQVVLQGKSRNLIIRELQRTNLDVNLAVNNLLSRDDEGDDDGDESGEQYISEDLISLLDAGIHIDHPSVIVDADVIFNEDMFGYSSLRTRAGSRSRTATDRDHDPERDRERESMFRIRERSRWLTEGALRDELALGRLDRDRTDGMLDAKKPASQSPSPLVFGEELQFWQDRDGNCPRFSHIAAMHSELVAVNINGQLCQWKWFDPEPFSMNENPVILHPKASSLALAQEKIIGLAACSVRASVWTESGKVATWVDDSLNIVSAKLEHPAQVFAEFQTDKIVSLHVCSLYTCARLESGNLYWWGVMPFGQRKKVVEKARSKGRRAAKNAASGESCSRSSEIVAGMQVCLRSCPIYHVGATGFTTVDGIPKVGQLMEAAWTLNDTRRFKIKTSFIEPKPELKPESKPSDTFKPDMPPPPSPASSTCSDHSGHSMVSPGPYKRKKQPTPVKEVEKKDEEEWSLKDVIFTEDVRTVPVGRVLKVDGAYAAVRFPGKEGSCSEDPSSPFQDCRLLRKDDLVIVRGSSAPRIPDCFQKTPKKVSLPDCGKILTVAIDSQGIHMVCVLGSHFKYYIYDLSTNKMEQSSMFPTDTVAFLGQSERKVKLYNAGENSPVILCDGNSTIYPLGKDCLDGIRDPRWLDLPPLHSLGMTIQSLPNVSPNAKNKTAVIVMAVEAQALSVHILRHDLEKVKAILAAIEGESDHSIAESKLKRLLQEHCDGNRNIFHTAVTICIPSTNKDTETDLPLSTSTTTTVPTSTSSMTLSSALESLNPVEVLASIHARVSSDQLDRIHSRSMGLREMMRRATSSRNIAGFESRESEREDSGLAIPTISWAPDPPPLETIRTEAERPGLSRSNSSTSLSGLGLAGQVNVNHDMAPLSMSPVKLDDKERRVVALQILKTLCDVPVLAPHLLQLLTAKNAEGFTPFMQAVCARAYPAAILLLDTAKQLATRDKGQVDKEVFLSMLYPPGSGLDNSPLQVVCCNDTCSFTWTGDEHINQDIFECRTCGLVGTLCCCTECARVCHKGHDCELKRTSPTAYCDCWEKCKCRSLVGGNQSARFDLLSKLLSETDLVKLPNSRGENILLFLVQTVGRQLVEQRQFKPSRVRATARKTPISDIDPEMPEHNLEPPRFSRKALERILNDWTAVKAMLMTGCRESKSPRSAQNTTGDVIFEDQHYLNSQNGTMRLDKFTHTLIVKCSVEMLDTLLTTLIREILTESHKAEAKIAARRFVRSVARIFVVLNAEMAPQCSKKKSSISISQPLVKCRRVFQALINIAVEELCETADALIAPVRMGVARPTAPFSLVTSSIDCVQGSEELFTLDPLPVRTTTETAEEAAAPYVFRPRAPTPATAQSEAVQDREDEDVASAGEVEVVESLVEDQDTMEHPSEHDDRQSEHSEHEAENHPPENEEVVAESDMDLDLLGETDSDSESNHSNLDNASIQRSAVTAARAGSDTGLAYFSDDDESGESTNPDEEDSEAGESDEHQDAVPLDDLLEQRSNAPAGTQNHRTLQAPQTMQWAIRQRDTSTAGRSAATPSAGSGLIYIDPHTLRRTATCTIPTSTNLPQSQDSSVTMMTTASQLARVFGILIRQIADLLMMLQDYHALAPNLPCVLDISYQEAIDLQLYLEYHLKPNWDWLICVMDSTEAQLRFGSALSETTDPSHKEHPQHANYARSHRTERNARGEPRFFPPLDNRRRGRVGNIGFDGNSARRGFLTYALSLMRSHNDEHSDTLPVIDISALKHVAYVLDALIYYMRSGTDADADMIRDGISVNSWQDPDENLNDEDTYDPVNQSIAMETESLDGDSEIVGKNGRKHPFFHRSESTTFLGCPPLDPFETTLVKALPLADQPHLLHPNARKEDLFGMPKPTVIPSGSDKTGTDGLHQPSPFDRLPTHLALSMRTADVPHGGRVPSGFSTTAIEVPPCSEAATTVCAQPATSSNGTLGESSGVIVHPGLQPAELSSGEQSAAPVVTSTQATSGTPYVSPGSSESPGVSAAATGIQPSTSGLLETASTGQSASLSSSQCPFSVLPNFGKSPAVTQPSVIVHAGSAHTLLVPPSSLASKDIEVPVDESSKDEMDAEVSATSEAMDLSTNRKGRFDDGKASIEDSSSSNSAGITAGLDSNSTPMQVGESNSEGTSKEPAAGGANIDMVGANENVSNTIVVETSQIQPSTSLPAPHRNQSVFGYLVSPDSLLGRWRLSLELFGRVFCNDVGAEPGSIISELGGFPVKETRFRYEMEKIRNTQQRDLSLEVERDRNSLLVQTFKQLNTQYNRRTNTTGPPLAVHRVKVTFKDEPGEGSGVARSFYTAFAQAVLSSEKLPSLEGILVGTGKALPYNLLQRLKSKERERQRVQRRSREREGRLTLSYDSPPFYMTSDSTGAPGSSSAPEGPGEGVSSGSVPAVALGGSGTSSTSVSEAFSNQKRRFGERLLPKVQHLQPSLAPKITGMLLDLPPSHLYELLTSEERLQARIEEAADICMAHGREMSADAILELGIFNLSADKNKKSTTASSTTPKRTEMGEEEEDLEDLSPLFWQPGKRGYYSPRPGKGSAERLSAFRNVGRVIGLCFIQNELIPLLLNRHVIKYILGRKISWHDLAFFDPVMYESLRQLILDAETKDGSLVFSALDLTFSVELSPEEGGEQVELIPGGADIEVTASNVYDYVRRYAEYRMVDSAEKCLQQMKLGVFDVIPRGSLDGLSAEDFRLLLNGVGDISVQTLISYTSFNDESGEGGEKVQRFKRWFWSIVEKMTTSERQDLVYFWTSSPALPASEEGFQPMPSITVRPADDNHLPTANTCISRLYIPLYSSRSLLRQKLLLAIKTKSFGFV